MAGSDSCSLLLGCNWSAAVAAPDRFWRGSAETRSGPDETPAPFPSANITSEEPAGDSRLFPRMGSLQNKAELGKICCVRAERRLLCPDGSRRPNRLLRPQRISFGFRLKLVVVTLSKEKQPGIKAGPAVRDLGGVIFGMLHKCVFTHFLLWPEPRLSLLFSPRRGVLRPSNPGSPVVPYVLTKISIIIWRPFTANMLQGALLRVRATRIQDVHIDGLLR